MFLLTSDPYYLLAHMIHSHGLWGPGRVPPRLHPIFFRIPAYWLGFSSKPNLLLVYRMTRCANYDTWPPLFYTVDLVLLRHYRCSLWTTSLPTKAFHRGQCETQDFVGLENQFQLVLESLPRNISGTGSLLVLYEVWSHKTIVHLAAPPSNFLRHLFNPWRILWLVTLAIPLVCGCATEANRGSIPSPSQNSLKFFVYNCFPLFVISILRMSY